MRPFWFSLRSRIAIGIFAVALLPVLVMTGIDYRASREQLRRAAQLTAQLAAARAAADVDALHTRSLDYLRTFARVEAIQHALAGIAPKAAPDHEALRRLLQSMKSVDPLYLRTVALTDTAGRVLIDDTGRSTATRWMIDELETMRSADYPAMSHVTARGDTGVLEAAAPVLHDGRHVGYVVMRYDAAVLQVIIERQRTIGGSNLIAWINDDKHVRLAGESPAVPLLTSAQKFAPQLRDSLIAAGMLRTELPRVRVTRKIGHPVMLPDSSALFETTETYGPDSVRTLLGASVPTRTLPWQVSMAMRESDAVAPARELMRRGLPAAVLLMLVAALLALFGAHRLVRPLHKLAGQARRIADGDFSARVSLGATDEMDELGRAFNELAERTGAVVTALAERSRELERDIQERARLEHELTDARRLEAIGRLAGGVAHDFNNLLTVILSNLSMAEETLPPTSPEAADVRAARAAAERGAELTKQLLAYSRRGVVVPRAIDLARLVKKLEPLVKRLAGDTVSLSLDIPANLTAPVLADPTQCDQVVINLAANARDAMPRGGRLEIGVRRLESDVEFMGLPPGSYAELWVRDTGEGMSPDTLARAFEPFFTTKELGRGTGLGLATVYGIVTRAGGSVHIESAPGQGTCFFVRIPITAETVEADSGPRDAAGVLPGRGEMILLAEDNDAVRDSTRRQLSDLGYRVLAVSDGQQALEMARHEIGHLRLVLSDVLMPHLDGPALRARLREEFPQLPVLLMSGNPPEDTAELQRRGEFIAKPFHLTELSRRVRALIDGTAG